MSTSVQWRGDKAFQKRLAQAKARLKREVPVAMTEVIAKTHSLAVSYTPRVSGELQETSIGRVAGKEVSTGGEWEAAQTATVTSMGNSLTGKIAYRKPYARKLHEHNVTGREKFLELATAQRKEANKQRFREVKVVKG